MMTSGTISGPSDSSTEGRTQSIQGTKNHHLCNTQSPRLPLRCFPLPHVLTWHRPLHCSQVEPAPPQYGHRRGGFISLGERRRRAQFTIA